MPLTTSYQNVFTAEVTKALWTTAKNMTPRTVPPMVSAAAVDVGAADRDRSDCFELSEIPVRPMGRAIFGGSHDSGASGERRRKHVNDDLDPADVDA